MPSVFTLEAPTGFGAPVPNPDYLELLGDPLSGYDIGLGHGHVQGIADAMLGGPTEFFRDRGLLLGSVMAFGTALVVGVIVGQTAIYGFQKLGWRPPE